MAKKKDNEKKRKKSDKRGSNVEKRGKGTYFKIEARLKQTNLKERAKKIKRKE